MQRKAYTYILECNDKTFYIGWTFNLENRLLTHNKGLGAKYTKSRRPVKLVYFESANSRSLAMKKEFQWKKLTKLQKKQLVTQNTSTSL